MAALLIRTGRSWPAGTEAGSIGSTSRQGDHRSLSHLDLDFYDRLFRPGAYLRTHAEHMKGWHGWREES
jgi:hypothetical protein